MGNENDPKSLENNYYMSVNLIGKSMKDLLIAISGLSYSSKSSGRSTKVSIFDYWDYSYFPELNFISQVKEITERFNKMKNQLILNFRECLIVHINDLNCPQIDYILENVNKINRTQYIPMILFLADNYNENDKTILNLKTKIYSGIISRYNNLDHRMIFFEKYQEEVYDEEKMNKIKNTLLRFCSYYNELSDRFSIGQGDKEIFYDLTEDNFPFTINIGCIGRFGKGKSTAVNFLLGEKKAKENRSGTSATSKINFYHVSHFPVKIYDIPGFENENTILNTVEKFKELNKEINKLKDEIHIILYFIKSTDERMFSEMEYKIFKQISKHEDVRVIFVLTHSSSKTDHKELIDMINTGIKGVLENTKKKK
jgi:GTP-binding protein EngB required for normal cell division